jgi:O-antigen/teichoic acid export membrane protein
MSMVLEIRPPSLLRGRRIRSRARIWSQLLASFVFSTAAGQMLGMLAGLIYVRYLPVDQYAFYAVCLASLAFVGLFSDFGLTGSAIYFWRKAKAEGSSFAAYLEPIRKMRLWLIVLGGSAAALIVPSVAARNGVSPWTAAIGVLIIIVTARIAAGHVLNQQVLRLSGRFGDTYLADMAGQVVRLAMAAVLVAGVSVGAVWALLGGMAGAFAAWLVSRVRARPAIERAPQGRAPDRPGREVLGYVLPVAPGVSIYALQDTAILWIAAAAGGPAVVASVFALGRIGAIFSVVGNFVLGVIVPRLAANNDDARFGRLTWGLRGVIFVALLVAMAFSVLFPQVPLWLLGPNYAHLTGEVPIVVGIAALNLLAFTSGTVNRARGWVRAEALLALVHGVAVAAMILNWRYSNADDVLWLMLAVSASHCLMHFAVSVAGIVWPHRMKL